MSYDFQTTGFWLQVQPIEMESSEMFKVPICHGRSACYRLTTLYMEMNIISNPYEAGVRDRGHVHMVPEPNGGVQSTTINLNESP